MTAVRWMECFASEGQFHDEYAVRGTDFRGEEFSFFVASEFVELQEKFADREVPARLKVIALDENNGMVLIQLPGRTFGNGSTITVKGSDLSECKECEPV